MSEMDTIRKEKFWSSDFLANFTDKVKLFTYAQNILCCVLPLIIGLALTDSIALPKFIIRDTWPWWTQLIYKANFIFLAELGFYIGAVFLSYYNYGILHCYFQMMLLRVYIKQQMGSYRSIHVKHKFYSKLYQKEVRDILLQSIKQYSAIKMLRVQCVMIFLLSDLF